MDIPQCALGGIRIENPGVGHGAGDIGVDGHVQPGLPQLAEYYRTELGHMERSGAQRDQRLRPGLLELVARGPGNPLRQHRQSAASLLKLRERAPLALEHRQGRGVKRVARLETAPQELRRSTMPVWALKARVKYVRAKNCAGSL